MSSPFLFTGVRMHKIVFPLFCTHLFTIIIAGLSVLLAIETDNDVQLNYILSVTVLCILQNLIHKEYYNFSQWFKQVAEEQTGLDLSIDEEYEGYFNMIQELAHSWIIVGCLTFLVLLVSMELSELVKGMLLGALIICVKAKTGNLIGWASIVKEFNWTPKNRIEIGD